MSKLKKKSIIENFGGGANSDLAGIYLPNGFVPESLNVDFSMIKGAARKRKGYKRINSAALSGDVVGIYQTKLRGVWTQIICAGEWVYKWDGATTFTGLTSGVTGGKNDLWDFTVAKTAADGDVIVGTNGVDRILKYDGDNADVLSLSEGYNYFKSKYVAFWHNHLLFANTYEGANLADDWTNTAGTIYSYDNTDLAFQVGIEIAEVYNQTTLMTEETVTPTTPSSGEYGVSGGVLYVNIAGAPTTKIHITYQCVERVRWSDLGDAQAYTAASCIDAVTNFGQGIVRIMPLRDLLMIYKEDSIWALFKTGDYDEPFGMYCVDHNTPCLAGFTVQDIKGEHYFLSEEGILKTNGAKVEPALVSADVPDWFKNISRAEWKYAYASVNPYLKQYRLHVPNQGVDDATDKDREIRFDYQDNIWSEHKYYTAANTISTMVNSNTGTWDTESRTWDDISESWNSALLTAKYNRFYTGDYNGYLREHDGVESDYEAAARAIESYVITKPQNLSEEPEDIDKNKRLLKVRARMDAFTGSSVTFDKKEDNNQSWVNFGTVDCDDSFDRAESKFVASLDISGTCKEVQYKIGNNAAVQPFTLYWIATEYILRGEK